MFRSTQHHLEDEAFLPESIREYRRMKDVGHVTYHKEKREQNEKESNVRKQAVGRARASHVSVDAFSTKELTVQVQGHDGPSKNKKEKKKKLKITRKLGKIIAPGPVPDPDIIAMLSKSTWSVRSLLPPTTPTKTISQKELHHLLRLSALPLPKSQAEEDKMLDSLHSQLHFVGDIQSVNTDGIEPLVRIAEETEGAIRENTIGLEDLRHVLDKEIVVGRNKRRRRVRSEENVGKGEDWDVFKTASETVEVPGSGRYFVVRSGKGVPTASGDAVA